MITIVHGGQTGVDRGAHDTAVEHGWRIMGYMPRDGRDELGPIPLEVARYLIPHASTIYAARTAANVAMATAILIVVRDSTNPRATPGTAKTIDRARDRGVIPVVVDPSCDERAIARWLHSELIAPWPVALLLPGIQGPEDTPAPARLLVAGPRESRWGGAHAETCMLLRRIAPHETRSSLGDAVGSPRTSQPRTDFSTNGSTDATDLPPEVYDDAETTVQRSQDDPEPAPAAGRHSAKSAAVQDRRLPRRRITEALRAASYRRAVRHHEA